MTFPFQHHPHFLQCPPPRGDEPFALAGLCWDGATTNRPGARFGPGAIRAASQLLCDGTHPLFDTSPQGQLADLGDLPLPHTSLAAVRQALAAQVPALVARHHMVWLGGDHSLTLSLLRAYRQHFGQPLALIHFDAHCDTWSDHFGEPSGHGTWVHEALQEGLLRPEGVVQIGIRSAAERAARERVSAAGGLVFDGRSLRGLEGAAQAPLLHRVRERMAALSLPPIYISLDIDCLDPACAPGTGTPEPGGLSNGQLLTLLEDLATLNCVGMDCMEVSPPYDHAQLTSLAAAHAVWTYLCARLARPPQP